MASLVQARPAPFNALQFFEKTQPQPASKQVVAKGLQLLEKAYNAVYTSTYQKAKRRARNQRAYEKKLQTQTGAKTLQGANNVLSQLDQTARNKKVTSALDAGNLAEKAFIQGQIAKDAVPAQILKTVLPPDEFTLLLQRQSDPDLMKKYMGGSGLDRGTIQEMDKLFTAKADGSMDQAEPIPPDQIQSLLQNLADDQSEQVANKVRSIVEQLVRTVPYVGTPLNLAMKTSYLLNAVQPQYRKTIRRYVSALLSAGNAGASVPKEYESLAEKYMTLVSGNKHNALIGYLNSPQLLIDQLSKARADAKLTREPQPVNIYDSIVGNSNPLTYGVRQINLDESKNLLSLFPHWGASQAKKQKAQLDALRQTRQNFDDISNPNSAHYRNLNGVNQSLAKWNVTSKSWQGTGVDEATSMFKKRMRGIQSKFNKGKMLLQQKLSPAEAQAQVPLIVRQLVEDNQNVGSNGFGPIKSGGPQLYAGRWLDKYTGNIRVLPTATKQFVNPVSSYQNISYHQARQLNHWNNILDDQYSIKLIQKDPASWQDKQRTRLQRSLVIGENLEESLKKVCSNLTKFRNAPVQANPSYTDVIYANIPADQLLSFIKSLQDIKTPSGNNSVESVAADKKINDENNKLWTQYKKMIREATIAAVSKVQKISAKKLPENQKALTIAKIQQNQLRLISLNHRTLATSLKNLYKSIVIPRSNNMQDILQATQKYQQVEQGINNWLNNADFTDEDMNRNILQFTDKVKTRQNIGIAAMDTFLKQLGVEAQGKAQKLQSATTIAKKRAASNGQDAQIGKLGKKRVKYNKGKVVPVQEEDAEEEE